MERNRLKHMAAMNSGGWLNMDEHGASMCLKCTAHIIIVKLPHNPRHLDHCITFWFYGTKSKNQQLSIMATYHKRSLESTLDLKSHFPNSSYILCMNSKYHCYAHKSSCLIVREHRPITQCLPQFQGRNTALFLPPRDHSSELLESGIH